MAYIRYLPGDETDGRLRRLYEAQADDDGLVDHIIWIHSVNSPAMGHHLRLYEHAMRGPSPLSRIQREMIAVTVSAANDCFY